MGTLVLLVCCVLPALAVCFDYFGNAMAEWPFPNPVFHEAWPGALMPHGHFLPGNLFQTPSLPEPWPGFPMPFQTLDVGTGFAIKLLDSSWSGPAGSNVYPRGALVYLQVSSSLPPDQQLYIQSCYAAPSPDMGDDSRLPLVLNKGCVSSEPSVIRFISRKKDSIDLLMDTSTLKFSQIYLHCRVLASMSALTPDTKSCNYDQSKASWVELGGRPGVCDCCATKCRSPPYLGGPFSETKAIISTGPLSIKGFKDEEEEESRPSVLTHSLFTSSVVSSPLKPAPRSASAPWFSPLLAPSPVWFPPGPVPQTETRHPRHAVGFPSPDLDVPTFGAPKFTSPGWDHVEDEPANLGQVHEEALRGDVFMNYKWANPPAGDAHGLAPPLENTEEKETTGNWDEMIELEDGKKSGCDPDGTGFVRRSMLAFTLGSGAVVYQQEEKDLSLPDPEGKRTGARPALPEGPGEGEPVKPGGEEVQSLLDMLRGLNKMVTGLEPR